MNEILKSFLKLALEKHIILKFDYFYFIKRVLLEVNTLKHLCISYKIVYYSIIIV